MLLGCKQYLLSFGDVDSRTFVGWAIGEKMQMVRVLCSTRYILPAKYSIFKFQVTADYNDNGFNLYSLCLNMKLYFPKCQCSFMLLTTVYILGFHTISRDKKDNRHSSHVGVLNKRNNQNSIIKSTPTWPP